MGPSFRQGSILLSVEQGGDACGRDFGGAKKHHSSERARVAKGVMKEIVVLSGNAMTSEEAQKIGLVNRVFPAEQ